MSRSRSRSPLPGRAREGQSKGEEEEEWEREDVAGEGGEEEKAEWEEEDVTVEGREWQGERDGEEAADGEMAKQAETEEEQRRKVEEQIDASLRQFMEWQRFQTGRWQMTERYAAEKDEEGRGEQLVHGMTLEWAARDWERWLCDWQKKMQGGDDLTAMGDWQKDGEIWMWGLGGDDFLEHVRQGGRVQARWLKWMQEVVRERARRKAEQEQSQEAMDKCEMEDQRREREELRKDEWRAWMRQSFCGREGKEEE
jgi:hypothetical protein